MGELIYTVILIDAGTIEHHVLQVSALCAEHAKDRAEAKLLDAGVEHINVAAVFAGAHENLA